MDSPAAARWAVGQFVHMEGTARDAKPGAALVSGDPVVYCLVRDSWPADVSGKRVAVQDTLDYTK